MLFPVTTLGQSGIGVDTLTSTEMHLLPEPLFSIPSDNTHIVTITGADNGRIFMAGKDGSLYELRYQVWREIYSLPNRFHTVMPGGG